jgi:hypothetical protein
VVEYLKEMGCAPLMINRPGAVVLRRLFAGTHWAASGSVLKAGKWDSYEIFIIPAGAFIVVDYQTVRAASFFYKIF